MTTGKVAVDRRPRPRRPIVNDAELDREIAALDDLLDKRPLTPADAARIDILAERVRRYETCTIPAGRVTVAERLGHLLELHGLSRQGLARAAGVDAAAVGRVLGGTGSFTFEDANRLGKHFALDPSAFLPTDFKIAEPMRVQGTFYQKGSLVVLSPVGAGRAKAGGVVVRVRGYLTPSTATRVRRLKTRRAAVRG